MHSYEISIILKILFKYMDYIHYMSILTDVFIFIIDCEERRNYQFLHI